MENVDAFEMHMKGLICIIHCVVTLSSVHLMFGNRDERFWIGCLVTVCAQTDVVVAIIGVKEEADDKAEIDLPNDEDEVAIEEDAIVKEDMTRQQLRDFMAQALR